MCPDVSRSRNRDRAVTAVPPQVSYNAAMQRYAFAAVLAVYLVLAAQYAALTPDWQAPDEPAHYNVVRQIAQTGALPVLEPGDYDQAFEQVVGNGFPPEIALDRVQYQDYQPPLYYVLAVPAFWIGVGRSSQYDWSRCCSARAPCSLLTWRCAC